MMLKELKLQNFKAFERFTVTFGDRALLVGANNAGKSTLIAAVRLTGRLIRLARRYNPSDARIDGGITRLVYPFSGTRLGFVEENLQHEFEPVEVRLQAKFSNNRILTAVWPVSDGTDDGEDAFFYLDTEGGPPRSPKVVRESFPEIGIVPVLTPLEQAERMLDAEYVQSNVDGRLTSRHVRNHVFLLQQEHCENFGTRFNEFQAFAEPWLPEMQRISLRPNFADPNSALDLFYLETGGRTEREVYWAGDGLQVWLQILMHVFRLRTTPIILMDEPDIYLHADLQRRLVRLLEDMDAQTITATHSSEMISEASSRSIVWVDKTRARGVRAPRDEHLRQVSDSLGTAFNLHLARAFRSRVVLFVEGQDMRIVRALARRLGANALASEQGIAIVKLEGFSQWDQVQPFQWLLDSILERAVVVWVLLDRDYRNDLAVRAIEAELAELSIRGHLWRRKELENYLLEVPTLCRCAGVSEEQIRELLTSVTNELRDRVFSRLLAEEQRVPSDRRASAETAIEQFSRGFDESWMSLTWRLRRGPAKHILSSLNDRLQQAGHRSVSFRQLANTIRRSELATEVGDLLLEIEASLE